MGFLEKLFGKKKSSEIFTNEEIFEAGACPNCWGTQAYDGQYREYVKDQTKDNINHDSKHQKAFIQQFVETHVSGIQLKNDGNGKVCKNCGVSV